jgi:hypothetical protein
LATSLATQKANLNGQRLTIPASSFVPFTMNSDCYATKYVPIGYRTPSPEEIIARRTARDLKIPTALAIQIAAPQMAALIDGPCWLVPVPASNGTISANLELARAIAELVPGARVKCALSRAHSVESSSARRMRGLLGLTVEQHAIIRTARPMEVLPLYFVDNLITTGTTMSACLRALGWGIGLAYADASRFTCAPRFGTGFDHYPAQAD